MSDDTPNTRPAHYCARCTNVLEELDDVCLDCGSERPSEGWASIQDGYDPWLGRTLDERYFITKRLGRGSVGAVYRAKSVAIARSFAVKIVNLKQTPAGLDADQIRARLKREVNAIGKLRNPHIVPFYETLELYGSFIGVVMDLVEGQTLEEVVNQGAFDTTRALKVLRQISNGLHEAHSAGMIHRDLKPENIMVERLPAGDDFIHILDFGIVRVDDGVSMTRGFLGTPLYASPEQAMAGELDARSDIYALGAVLYFMLTGEPPYMSENVYEILRAHVGAPVPTLQDATGDAFPEALEQMVSQMLAKAPSNRPQDLAEVIKKIDAFQKHGFILPNESGSIDPISVTVRQTGEQKSLGNETSEEVFGPAATDTPAAFTEERDKTGPKAGIFKRGPTRRTVKSMLDEDRAQRTLDEFDYVVSSETGVFPTGIQVGIGVTAAASSGTAVACVTEQSDVWVKRNQNVEKWYSSAETVTAVSVSPDAVVIGTESGKLLKVNAASSEVVFADIRHAKITAIDIKDGVMLAASESGRLYRHWLNDDAGWTRIQNGPPIDAVTLSDDGQLFAVARRNKEIQIFRTSEPKRTINEHTTKHACRSLAFSNDCQLVAVALEDDSVSILHVIAQETLMNVKGAVGSIVSLYFNEKNELHGLFEKEGVLFRLDLNRTMIKVQS